jgi:aryl-alcohol dehydrogenase-like predicted oxidoreductase
MKYRRLGKAGVKLSELSFGSWLTFGNQISDEVAEAESIRPEPETRIRSV